MSLGLEKTAANSRSFDRRAKLKEKEFRPLADETPGWISYIDAQERFQYVNATCAEWLARIPSKILHKKFATVGPATYLELKPHIEDVLAGKEVAFERELFFADGRRRAVRIRLVPEWSGLGQVSGFYAFLFDLAAEAGASGGEGVVGKALRPAAPTPGNDGLASLIAGVVDLPISALPREGLIHETPSRAVEAVYGAATPASRHAALLRPAGDDPATAGRRAVGDESASADFWSVVVLAAEDGTVTALRVRKSGPSDIALEGPVAHVDPVGRRITLLGLTIALEEDAETYDAAGARIGGEAFLAQLRPGDPVRIELPHPAAYPAARRGTGLAG